MLEEINVIVGKENVDTLKAIYSIKNKFDIILIIIDEYNFRIAGKSKYVKKKYYCNNEFIAMMLLQTEFEQYKKIHVTLTSKNLIEIYKKNKNYYNNRFYINNIEYDNIKKIEPRIKYCMMVNHLLCKININKLFYYYRKVYHKDIEQYIVIGESRKVPNIICEYDIIEIDNSNYSKIFKDLTLIKEIKKLLKSKNTRGIAILDNNKLVGKAFIKGVKAKDRVFKIMNYNSYVIALMNIEEEYRGKKLQQVLISELIKRFIKDKENSKIYAYIYTYNKPSLNNFLSCGFKVIKKKKIIRFLKCTLNKDKI